MYCLCHGVADKVFLLNEKKCCVIMFPLKTLKVIFLYTFFLHCTSSENEFIFLIVHLRKAFIVLLLDQFLCDATKQFFLIIKFSLIKNENVLILLVMKMDRLNLMHCYRCYTCVANRNRCFLWSHNS